MEHQNAAGSAKMLQIYIGENDQWEGKQLYEAIVLKLRELDIAGVTVSQGIMGYGAKQRAHSSHFLSLSSDLPIQITVVDKEEKLEKAISILNPMVANGLMIASKVEVIKYTHGKSDVDA
jgi:PII-like signaling protein